MKSWIAGERTWISLRGDTGRIMRHHYPADPWTPKAAPFVWLGEKKEN
jgi:hypothetical protein